MSGGVAAMLTDAQLDRWSRQVLLPEVGGRGQERLLAAHVALAGAGPVAEAAGALLARAGIGTLHLVGPAPAPRWTPPDCRVVQGIEGVDLLVDCGTARPTLRAPRAVLVRGAGARGVVTLVVGRPCADCVDDETCGDVAPTPPVALALGALAATEAMRALLVAPATGRRHHVDLGSGAFDARPLPPSAGCVYCRGSA